ncbi:hypothetical protein BU16DRAFT_420300, partial [Lophium mytilinum]
QHGVQRRPLSVLQTTVRSRTRVLISCRKSRKLLTRVNTFDRYCNTVLGNKKEIWTLSQR